MQLDGLNKWNMSLAFTLKTLVGICFIYIYSEVYGDGTLSADAGVFMRESKTLNEVFFQSPLDYLKFLTGIGDNHELQMQYLADTRHWDVGLQSVINDNKNIIRIHSLIHFFSFNHAMIHTLFMCLISLVGVRSFLIGLKERTKLNINVQFWILILIPSVLFWTSGILKEPLLFLGLGILVRGLLGRESQLKKVIFTLLGLFLLIGFKPYVLASILPVFLFLGFYRILPKFKIIGALLVLLLSASSSLIIFSDARDKAVHFITRKQQDFKNIGMGGIYAWNGNGFYYFKPDQFDDIEIDSAERQLTLKKDLAISAVDVGGFESPHPIELRKSDDWYDIYFMRDQSKGYIEIPDIDDSFSQLMKNIPGALRNSLMRPFITDPGSALKYPAVLETWLVFLFLFYAILKRRRLEKTDHAILVSLILFIVILSTVIGLTTPVLGAIVRYRIPVYIAMVIIGILIIDPHKKLKS